MTRTVHEGVGPWTKRLTPLGIVSLMLVMFALPAGQNVGGDHSGYWDEARQEYVHEYQPKLLGSTTGRIIGQFTFQFLLISLLFAWPRPLGLRIGHDMRRWFHLGIGTTIVALALGHAAILIANQVYRGWLSGTVSTLVLILHGGTGMARGPLARRLGAARWRHIHMATAWTGLLIGLQHALVYGEHYGLLREVLL